MIGSGTMLKDCTGFDLKQWNANAINCWELANLEEGISVLLGYWDICEEVKLVGNN